MPNDSGIFEKEKEKIEKYQDLRREIAKLWSIKMSVVPIVVGALGTVTNNLGKHQKTINWCHSNSRTLTKGSITQNS